MDDGDTYPARLDIDYPERLDRLTSFFRLIWAIPILVILGLLNSGGTLHYVDEAGETVRSSGAGITAGLFVATLLMILFPSATLDGGSISPLNWRASARGWAPTCCC